MSALSLPAAAPAAGPVLRGVQLPPAPSWWPPAPGWWALAVLLVLLLAAALLGWRRVRRRRRRRAQLLAEVDALQARFATDGDAAALASGLHQLLRRAARPLAGEAAIRAQGAAWREVLAQVPVDVSTLDRLMALETSMYRPHQPLDAAGAVAATRTWLTGALRRRRRAPGPAMRVSGAPGHA